VSDGSSSKATGSCHVGIGTIATALVAFSMALLTYFGI
jgi:hypothetical protein